MRYIVKDNSGKVEMFHTDATDVKEVPNAQIYIIEEGDEVEFDSTYQTLQKEYLYLDEYYGDSTHMKKCKIDYQVAFLPNEEIIQNLNDHLGVHLDTGYPEWKRSKHAGESLRFLLKGQANWTEEDLQRIGYITEFADWCKACRQERNEKEAALLVNGIIPTFEWAPKPEGLR